MTRPTLLFLLIVNITALGQTRVVEGKVVDSQTGMPVPFASIGLMGTTRGTSSNMSGQFSIFVQGSNFSMRISCLGYETQEVTNLPADGPVIIRLKPSVTQLQEMVIFSKRVNPDKIIRKAFSSVSDNNNTKPFVQKFFYRHYCKDDSAYGRLIEASVDVWKRKGYRAIQTKAGDKDEMRVTQLRRTFDKTTTAQGHVPIAINSILQADVIGYQANAPNGKFSFYSDVSNLKADIVKYDFSLEGITTYDGKEVYHIVYSMPKDSVLTTSGYMPAPGSMGSVYITTEEFAFVKMIDVKYWDKDTITTTAFYTPYKGKYYPYHLIRDGKSIARDNSTHWFHVELMASEILTEEFEEFTGKEPGKYELLQIPYDSAYWSNNTILKTTPLEDEIINDLGSGVSLNEQFKKYQQYELNTIATGNGDVKFDWLKQESKGKKALYVGFWSGACGACIQHMQQARKLSNDYKNDITFVWLSLETDEEKWKKVIAKYNFNTDGFVHYRIGDKSNVVAQYQLKQIPYYVLIDKDGNDADTNAKHPDNAQLKADIDSLLKTIVKE